MPSGIVSGTPSGMREALKKATTEMLVLFLLRQKEMYTYEMMTQIDRLSGGFITFNTLYQAIYRLQDHQYIRESRKVLSEAYRTRIFFTITPAGEEYYVALLEQYRIFTQAIDRVLAQDGKVDSGQEEVEHEHGEES